MATIYCNSCKRDVDAKRQIGLGTILLSIITFGLWLFLIPLYRKRCATCKQPIENTRSFAWFWMCIALFFTVFFSIGSWQNQQAEKEFTANREKIIELATSNLNRGFWSDVLKQTREYAHVQDIELQALRDKAKKEIDSIEVIEASKKEAKEAVLTLLEARFRDPRSAEFSKVVLRGSAVCGEVDTKSSIIKYSHDNGLDLFITFGSPESTYLQSESNMSGFSGMWDKYCKEPTIKTPTPSKPVKLTDSKESIPLSVPSDSKATYLVLSVEKAANKDEVYITTKRTGSSGVSFAKRLVNCQNQTFMYVGDADTLEELQMQNLKGEMGHRKLSM